MALSDAERALLEFEAQHPAIGSAKNEAIRAHFGLSPVRYYQQLARLAQTVEALQLDPVLVHRLRRIEDAEHRKRSTRAAPRLSS